jgi:hypothetical protein
MVWLPETARLLIYLAGITLDRYQDGLAECRGPTLSKEKERPMRHKRTH